MASFLFYRSFLKVDAHRAVDGCLCIGLRPSHRGKKKKLFSSRTSVGGLCIGLRPYQSGQSSHVGGFTLRRRLHVALAASRCVSGFTLRWRLCVGGLASATSPLSRCSRCWRPFSRIAALHWVHFSGFTLSATVLFSASAASRRRRPYVGELSRKNRTFFTQKSASAA